MATNAQPYLIECHRGPIAVGHNGNLVNADILRRELEAAGSIFQSTSDTEVILHLYARSHRERVEDAIAASLYKVMGAFSLLFLTPEALVAARDPWGFRPLVLGRLNGAAVVASETCALDLIDAEYVRDVEPGEVLVADADGVRSFKPFPPEPTAHCIFEHVYFARPDSLVFGRNVLESRLRLGRQLAREAPAEADVVVPDPGQRHGRGPRLRAGERPARSSGASSATTTWAGPSSSRGRASARWGSRSSSTRCGRSSRAGGVVLIDDSIVRGTTSRKIVRMMREAGAREVHMRISSPPTTGPCYYGIDTPLRSELIASSHSVEEIRRFIEADSLAYLSHARVCWRRSTTRTDRRHCTACFSGRYPVAVTVPDESQLRLFEKARA